MNKKMKVIAASALFTFALSTVPGLCVAKDSVHKWGYWEDMVTPAAGPQVANLIVPTIQDTSPDPYTPDPTPDPPTPDPDPDPDPPTPELFGYTTVHESDSYNERKGEGVATFSPYFDENGDPDDTAYNYVYFQENEGFNPTGTGGFSFSPFGQTASDTGVDGAGSGDMPTDFTYLGEDESEGAIVKAWGYQNDNPFTDDTGFQQWRELTDANGDSTGIYEGFWWHKESEGGEFIYYDITGQAYYGALAPQSYIDGPAKGLPELGGSEVVGDIGDISYGGRIQGHYAGYTQSGMDVSVGIDFNASTFAATFGADRPDGFAASGTLTGQHLQSTLLSGINDTIMISGEVRASLHGDEARSMTGGIDVTKTVIGDYGPTRVLQAEAFAASTTGISPAPVPN